MTRQEQWTALGNMLISPPPWCKPAAWAAAVCALMTDDVMIALGNIQSMPVAVDRLLQRYEDGRQRGESQEDAMGGTFFPAVMFAAYEATR